MKNKFLSEIIISMILMVILVTFAGTTKLAMPESTSMLLTVGLIAAFLVFTGLIWKEKSHDEREELHKSRAGHISFITGTSLLVTGIVIQSLDHHIDPWLIYALVGMILIKTIMRAYYQIKR